MMFSSLLLFPMAVLAVPAPAEPASLARDGPWFDLIDCTGSWCACMSEEVDPESRCQLNTISTSFLPNTDLPFEVSIRHESPDLYITKEPDMQNSTWTLELINLPVGVSFLVEGPAAMNNDIIKWQPEDFELTMELDVYPIVDGEVNLDSKLTTAVDKFSANSGKLESPPFFMAYSACTTEENRSIAIQISEKSSVEKLTDKNMMCTMDMPPCNTIDYISTSFQLVWADCDGNFI